MKKTIITYALGVAIVVLLIILSFYDYLFLIPLAIGSTIFIFLKLNSRLKKDFFRLISTLVVLTAKYDGGDRLNEATQKKLKDFLSKNGLNANDANNLVDAIIHKSFPNVSMNDIKYYCTQLNNYQHLLSQEIIAHDLFDLLFSAIYQTKKNIIVLKTIKEELYAESYIDYIYNNVKQKYDKAYRTEFQNQTNQESETEGQKKRQEFVDLTIKLVVEAMKADRSKMVCELDVVKEYIFKYDKEHFQERVEEVKKYINNKYDENVESLCKKILNNYSREYNKRKDILKILVDVVYADGICNEAEKAFLKKVAKNLKIFQSALDDFIRQYEKKKNNNKQHNYKNQQNSKNSNSQKQNNSQNQSNSQSICTSELEKAYAALGITQESTDRELNACWRNLMRVNHPDLMESKGPEAVRKATQKCQEINKAFEIVKASRGIK